MIIAPKIGDNNINLTEHVQSKMHGYFEIQMLGSDIKTSWFRCKDIMKNQLSKSSLNYVVLHMPFGYHRLPGLLISRDIEREFIEIVVDAIKFTSENKFNLDFLFHIEANPDGIEKILLPKLIKHIDSIINDTNVGILIENAICSLNSLYVSDIPAFSYMESIQSNNFWTCLDICHLKASENVLDTEIKLEPDLIRRIKTVHFSATLYNDGYRDKKASHGKIHNSIKSVETELEYLIHKGLCLDNLIIVTEITEEDYYNRYDMLREISLLEECKYYEKL